MHSFHWLPARFWPFKPISLLKYRLTWPQKSCPFGIWPPAVLAMHFLVGWLEEVWSSLALSVSVSSAVPSNPGLSSANLLWAHVRSERLITSKTRLTKITLWIMNPSSSFSPGPPCLYFSAELYVNWASDWEVASEMLSCSWEYPQGSGKWWNDGQGLMHILPKHIMDTWTCFLHKQSKLLFTSRASKDIVKMQDKLILLQNSLTKLLSWWWWECEDQITYLNINMHGAKRGLVDHILSCTTYIGLKKRSARVHEDIVQHTSNFNWPFFL